MDRNKILHDPRHLGVPSGTSKMISELTVRSAQTMQLSWIKISTVFKRIETSFHLSLVILEYHPVSPKWFLRLWYIWHNPCTYLALKLTLSPNGLKRPSIWASSPRVPSGASKIISEPMVRMAQTMHLSSTESNTVSKWTERRFYMTHVT
jgi:hypothetical protein